MLRSQKPGSSLPGRKDPSAEEDPQKEGLCWRGGSSRGGGGKAAPWSSAESHSFSQSSAETTSGTPRCRSSCRIFLQRAACCLEPPLAPAPRRTARGTHPYPRRHSPGNGEHCTPTQNTSLEEHTETQGTAELLEGNVLGDLLKGLPPPKRGTQMQNRASHTA